MPFRSPRHWATGFSRRADAAALVLAPVLALVPEPSAARSEARNSVAVAFGQMTDNTWQDVLFEAGSVSARDSWMAGIMVSREWPLWDLGYVGIEGQLNWHWGEQSHWEIAAPVYLRSLRPRQPYIPALAYGLGLSYAGDVPEVEVDRRGESQHLLAYWFIELEFASLAALRPFVRLHHRSDAFGVFEADTGSNVVALGLRRDF
jgi:hypothetical protein